MASTIIYIIFQTPTRLRMARVGWMLYSTCRTETMFWWGKKMQS